MSPQIVPVTVNVADTAKVRAFFRAAGHLVSALADCEDLPESVMDALDEIRLASVDLGVPDPGPYPR